MLVIGFLFLLVLFLLFLLFSIVSFSLALFLFSKKGKKEEPSAERPVKEGLNV